LRIPREEYIEYYFLIIILISNIVWSFKIKDIKICISRKLYYIIFCKCKNKDRRDQIIKIKILIFFYLLLLSKSAHGIRINKKRK